MADSTGRCLFRRRPASVRAEAEERCSLESAVEGRHWAILRRLTSSITAPIGQLLVGANAAVNHRHEEDNAKV